MKRFYIVAVVGLCATAPLRAQNGALAPTAPIVPPPVLHGGGSVTPAGGPLSGARAGAQNVWSPVRSPVVPSNELYTGPAPVAGMPCGPTGCGTAGCERGGFNWSRLKAWMCFRYTPTELPKMRPAPYITPLQGLFSCSSGAGGCAPCAAGAYPVAAPVGVPVTQPMPQPQQPPLQMPKPMKPPAGAGAIQMPPRGTLGAPAPTAWQRGSEFGTARTAAPVGPNGPVVNTGYRVPQK